MIFELTLVIVDCLQILISCLGCKVYKKRMKLYVTNQFGMLGLCLNLFF